MSDAPKKVWLDWPDANHGSVVYDEMPDRWSQEGQVCYIRLDAHADALTRERALADDLARALEHCLGTITCGMDGIWDHTIRPQDLARAALAAYRAERG